MVRNPATDSPILTVSWKKHRKTVAAIHSCPRVWIPLHYLVCSSTIQNVYYRSQWRRTQTVSQNGHFYRSERSSFLDPSAHELRQC